MKKVLSAISTICIAVAVCLFLLPQQAQAASESDLTFRLNSDGNSYTVTDCSAEASGELVIPATYDGKPVTNIGYAAFRDCSSLTSVTIPGSVTNIGNYAFSGCTSLTSVTIPDSVTSIGDYAFSGCTSLKSVTIPDSVTSIGYDAFYGCTIQKLIIADGSQTVTSTMVVCESTLQEVIIPGCVTSIGDYAFRDCSSLTSITIPKGVTSIGDYVFRDCSSLSSITIPDSVTSIDYGAFYGCSSLTSITIPDSVTSIGNYAFYNCTGLTEINFNATAMADLAITNNVFYDAGVDGTGITVNIGANVTRIPAYLFGSSSAPKITAVFFASGSVCESIGASAFSGCTSLTSVTIPDSVTSIGASAFSSCTSLAEITIPGKITSIGDSTFASCSSLTSITIPEGVTSIGSYAFSGCSGLTSVTIPDSVTSIGDYAFRNCTGLTSVTIPDSVTSIRYDPFDGCPIQKLIIADGSKTVKDTMVVCKSTLQEVVIPDSVTSIGKKAFSGCSSLTSITIPKGVTSIGEDAFYNCTGLTEINFNATAMADLAITNNVFYDAGVDGTGITVNIGANVTRIPACLFREELSPAPKITAVFFADSSACESIGASAFYSCSSLKSITIPKSVTSIGGLAFSECTGLTDVYITDPNAWCNISFYNESSNPMYYGACLHILDANGSEVTELVLDDTVTIIQASAFSGCVALKSITIQEGITSIGEKAFANCINLTAVSVPDSVKSIGIGAFSGCSGLESITIPFVGAKLNPDVYSRYPFGYIFGTSSYEGGLETKQWRINSSGGTTSSTYYIPASLKSVTVTGGNISDYAFSRCKSLASITIPEGVTSIGNYAFEYCSSLTSITIPDSVTSISEGAFYNCSGLTSITIPDSVTSIGSSAFSNCTGLTSITIPERVSRIERGTFNYCSNLTSVYIPSSISYIGYRAFGGTNIKDVYITDPNAWCNIRYGYYYTASDTQKDEECNPLYRGERLHLVDTSGNEVTEVVLASSVKSIPDYAFKGCTSLTRITIPESVTGIGYAAFYSCTSLTSITIPGSVTSIGNGAFRDCTGLTSVIIPDSVTSIGHGAFGNCTKLTDLTIGSGVTDFGENVFQDCVSLTNVTICNGVTQIGDEAFSNCKSLTSITIPGSVTSIGDSVFYGCSALASVTFGDGITSIPLSFYNCDNILSVTIPESVTSINDYRIKSCFHFLYKGTQEQWDNNLEDDIYYSGIKLHANARGDEVIIEETNLGATVYCTLCERQIGYVSKVESISVQSLPNKLQYLGKKDVLDVTGGVVLVHKIDGSEVTIPMTLVMVTGFNNTKAGTQTLTVTVDGKETTFDVEITKATVTFLDVDGTIISQAEYMYGDTVIVPPEPERPAGIDDSYVFRGWGQQVTTCTGEATYTAVFGPPYILGDIDGDQAVTQDDAVYLLLHTMFGEAFYPLNGAEGDIDCNGSVDQEDAVYLLLHTMFGESFYPLNIPALPAKTEE